MAQKCIQQLQKTLKMVSKWNGKLTPSGWQKMSKNVDLLRHSLKMIPSWGAKSGSWDSLKMRPKIIKKINIWYIFRSFLSTPRWLPFEASKKMVIFWDQAGGGWNSWKLIKNKKNATFFGQPKIHSKMIQKWYRGTPFPRTPKWIQNGPQNGP